MARPLLLDLFCCEGGAATGYHRAGFDVIGVDLSPGHLSRYPFPAVRADAIQYGALIGGRFDAVHASPPCQRYSAATASNGTTDRHPDLVGPTRDMLDRLGVPYVIENVVGAPLRQDVTLCGSMFDLKVRRHRVFELGGWWMMGDAYCPGNCTGAHREIYDVTGGAGGRNQTARRGWRTFKYHDTAHAREIMGMPWASRRGCTEAIPPDYTEYIGRQLMEAL